MLDFPQNPPDGYQHPVEGRTWEFDASAGGGLGAWGLVPVLQESTITLSTGNGMAEFVDEEGFSAFRVNPDTSVVSGAGSAPSYTANEGDFGTVSTAQIVGPGLNESDDNAFVFDDDEGFSPYAIGRTGEVKSLQKTTASVALVYAPAEPLGATLARGPVTGIIGDGQSNSFGSGSTPLTTTQPFSNVMDNGSALVPLVSLDLERPVVTACNYATATLSRKTGKTPAENVFACFDAGSGGASITAIQSGSASHNGYLYNIGQMRNRSSGFVAPIMNLVIGETDNLDGMSQATFKAAVQALRTSLQVGINSILARSDELYVVASQPAAYVTLNQGPSLALLELARTDSHFYLTCPMYRFPYSGDNIHLTAVGFKLMGAYQGRADAALLANEKPKSLIPLSAEFSGDTVVVRFRVPVAPLVLDTTLLAQAINHGFRVTDAGGTATISSITAGSDSVTIKCAAALSGSVAVRYGFDYLGAGLSIVNGASGNLRDSDPEVIEISGTSYQMFNPAPHFALTAFNLKV